MSEDMLLLVAARTDQPDIERRVRTVLAMAFPVNQPRFEAEVAALSLAEMAQAREALAALFSRSAVERILD